MLIFNPPVDFVLCYVHMFEYDVFQTYFSKAHVCYIMSYQEIDFAFLFHVDLCQ